MRTLDIDILCPAGLPCDPREACPYGRPQCASANFTANVAAIGHLIEQAEAQLRELRAEKAALLKALKIAQCWMPSPAQGPAARVDVAFVKAVLAKVSP